MKCVDIKSVCWNKWKQGLSTAVNLCCFVDVNLVISSMVLAPLAVSVIDHLLLMFHRCDAGHLHQMQACSQLAASIRMQLLKTLMKTTTVQLLPGLRRVRAHMQEQCKYNAVWAREFPFIAPVPGDP